MEAPFKLFMLKGFVLDWKAFICGFHTSGVEDKKVASLYTLKPLLRRTSTGLVKWIYWSDRTTQRKPTCRACRSSSFPWFGRKELSLLVTRNSLLSRKMYPCQPLEITCALVVIEYPTPNPTKMPALERELE